jgi:uncharacterized protein (DUF1778 family)
VALTQSQMIGAVADRAEMSKADTKRALAALDEPCSRSSEMPRRSGLAGSFS